jgi:hypothetical protein
LPRLDGADPVPILSRSLRESLPALRRGDAAAVGVSGRDLNLQVVLYGKQERFDQPEGELKGVQDSKFSGPAQLAERVLAAKRFDTCLTRQALTWLSGRGLSNREVLGTPLVASVQSHGRLLPLLADYFTSDVFLFRKEEP